jgi:phospholipid-translocating P-type ATPase (flippase)
MVSLDGADFMLNHKQLLLRGSQLRNTDWADGVVVYTGHDTKIFKNTEQAKYKSSNLEKKLNTEILFMLLFQAMLYVSLGLCNFIWNQKNLEDHAAYIDLKFGNVFEGFINMCAYFLLLNTMLPISLVVTLEVVKAFQCFHIYWDTDLYSRAKQRGCKIMSTTIHEELGQIEYIFTDKTGTLTANIMELKYLVIGDSEYFGTVDRDTALKNFQSKYVNEGEFYSERLHDILTNEQNNGARVTEPELVLVSEDEEKAYEIRTTKQIHMDFMTCLATCHECMVDVSKNQQSAIGYEGQSPDEITLVSGARQLGYVYLGSTSDSIVIQTPGVKLDLEVVSIFEFDNVRKRMSILIKDRDTYKLYVKGADNMIIDNLDPLMYQHFLENTKRKLKEYSTQGYRTLCMAMKILSEAEVTIVKNYLKTIQKDFNRNQLMFEFVNQLESNLYLLGCSAVEDRLQDHVPETLENLLRAGIKVWVLTGDKLETAENIAKSCNLIGPKTGILRLDNEMSAAKE